MSEEGERDDFLHTHAGLMLQATLGPTARAGFGSITQLVLNFEIQAENDRA